MPDNEKDQTPPEAAPEESSPVGALTSDEQGDKIEDAEPAAGGGEVTVHAFVHIAARSSPLGSS